jgi:type IV secretory pathway protease TraF
MRAWVAGPKFAMLRLFWLLARAVRALSTALSRLPSELAIALGAPEPDGSGRPQRLWIAIVVAIPASAFAAIVMPQITLVMTPSIDAWVVRKDPGPIVRGDYVMIELNHPVLGGRPVSITKQALCMPGSFLTWQRAASTSGPGASNTLFFCNGSLLATALPFTRNGRPLSPAKWNGVIPEGLAYIGSHHPHGFDSRYFGLVPIANLIRMRRIL